MKIVRVYGMSDVVEAASAAADAASAVGAAISSGGDAVGATLASLASGASPSVAQGAAALGAVALLSGGGDSNGDEEDEPEVIYDVGEDNFEDPEAPEESTPRHPRDPVQGVLNSCRAQAYHMWKRFELFLPTFFFIAGAFMSNLLPQLGDHGKGYMKVYYHHVKKKIGCAGNGIIRSSFYEPLDFILTVFNLDLQSLKNTELLSGFAINLCQWFCSISPSNLLDMTIQDAIDMEEMRYQEDNQKIYLPFVVCIFMYMMSHDDEECQVLGGAIRIKSYLKRLCLLIVESGVQELLVSIGVELSKACQAHEWLQGDMSWVRVSHNECAGEGESFFKKVKELDTSADPLNEDFGMSYFAYIMATSIQMIALASWAADTIPGHLVLTDVIMDLIFGFFNWGDAFGDEHPVKRGTGDIYNASKYSSAARSRARDRISSWLEYLKGKVGGFAALNRCKAAFDGPDLPTVEQFLEQHDFYLFFSFTLLHIEVYMYQEEEGWWPVFIFLHGPPCYMADSTYSMKVTPSIVESMKKRCKEMYAIFLICLKLREPDASSEIDRNLNNYSIFGNLLVAHAVYVYMICNVHIGRQYACIAFKNFLLGDECNAFDPCFHGLEFENPLVLSKSARQKLKYDGGSVNNTNFTREVLSCMSHCIEEARKMEVLREAAALIKDKMRDAKDSDSAKDDAALSNVKSRLEASYATVLQTLYDDTHAQKTDASRKRKAVAEAEEGEVMIKGVGVKSSKNGVTKYKVAVYFYKDKNSVKVRSNMTTIKAANEAKLACDAWKENNPTITADNYTTALNAMQALCDEKEALFGIDSE